MLVKFTNNSPEFEAKVEKLKTILSVGAASKVAEFCVNNYTDLDVRHQKALKENERLRDIINSLGDAVRAKKAADEEIQILLGEKL
jgi:hypothetical protein